MKILITGNEGFIGKNLSQYLVSKGHEVEGFEYKSDDIYPDPSRYDTVIHLGAISSTTETDVEKILKQNYEYTMNLITMCDKFGVNLQLASSASVYGTGEDGFTEKSKCYPKSPYAWSKYLVDRFLVQADVNTFNMNIQSFRYFNVYGQGEEHKGNQASPVSKFIEQAKHGTIKIFPNSANYERDFIWVGDVCRIHDIMLQKDARGIFNVGTGKTTSFFDIAHKVANKYDARVEQIPMPDNLKGQYQEYTCADLTNLNKHCNIEDYMTVKEYLDVYGK